MLRTCPYYQLHKYTADSSEAPTHKLLTTAKQPSQLADPPILVRARGEKGALDPGERRALTNGYTQEIAEYELEWECS
jgi:hypothetical protein